MLAAVDMHLRLGEIRHAAGMVAVEMRQQQVPHVARRITERLDLPNCRLGRVEPRRGLPDPFAPEPLRLGDVVEPDAGIDERKAVDGLDQQAVAHHPRPLEEAAGAVHQTPPDRAHGAGVEVMDAHDEPLFLKPDACLPCLVP